MVKEPANPPLERIINSIVEGGMGKKPSDLEQYLTGAIAELNSFQWSQIANLASAQEEKECAGIPDINHMLKSVVLLVFRRLVALANVTAPRK